MGSLNRITRKVHYWLAFATAIPVLVILGSGLLLQMKKHWSWVQPEAQRGTGKVPEVSFDQILATLQEQPLAEVAGWADVERLDVQPARGIIKAQLANGYEVQMDSASGAVLQVAYRRSDLIEAIHDGSFFAGDWTKLGIFLPAGIVLLILWASGIWLWLLPLQAQRARRNLAQQLREKQEVDPT